MPKVRVKKTKKFGTAVYKAFDEFETDNPNILAMAERGYFCELVKEESAAKYIKPVKEEIEEPKREYKKQDKKQKWNKR